MSDDGDLDEVLNDDLGEYSLLQEARSENNEESIAASFSSSSSEQEVLSKIAKLAEGQQVLIEVLTQMATTSCFRRSAFPSPVTRPS